MMKPLSVLLVTGLILSGCGGWSNSRVNPRNWFGSSQPVPVEAATETNPLMPARGGLGLFSRPAPVDSSLPIAKVTELRIEPTPSGAIVYAVGVASRQGPYATELRPVTTEEEAADGVMAFSFRVVYPREATVVGSELSRTVHDAYTLSNQRLRGVRVIRVAGRENALESRRR
ncbi:MAG: hypothetical protein ACK5MY_12915 [Jhaorihella sp.]